MTPEIKGLKRKFIITIGGNKVPLADPDPARSPEQVMSLYANQYPELTTATVDGPHYSDDGIEYLFKTTIGTKG